MESICSHSRWALTLYVSVVLTPESWEAQRDAYLGPAPHLRMGNLRSRQRKSVSQNPPAGWDAEPDGISNPVLRTSGQSSSLLFRDVKTAVPEAGLGHRQLVFFGPHLLSS